MGNWGRDGQRGIEHRLLRINRTIQFQFTNFRVKPLHFAFCHILLPEKEAKRPFHVYYVISGHSLSDYLLLVVFFFFCSHKSSHVHIVSFPSSGSIRFPRITWWFNTSHLVTSLDESQMLIWQCPLLKALYRFKWSCSSSQGKHSLIT